MVDAPRTIRELIAATRPWLEKKGVDNARLDAELLVAHALGMRRIDLFLDLDRPLSDDEVARCRELVRRRGAREPVSQIVGAREFFGLSFVVTADVLTPRPETEHLVELALARTPADAEGTFIDVCTGSGCVGISLLSERPQCHGVLTDVSSAALAVARINAERLGVTTRARLVEGDLLAPCAELRGVRFVVANPPYIHQDERPALAPEVRDHEPALALFGEGADALGHHRRLLVEALPLLATDGFVALEIGAGQGAAASAIHVDGYGPARLHKDLAGLDRIALFERSQG